MTEHKPTVFVVDDDDEVREALVDLIDSVGMHVESFASAQAFLDTYDPDRVACLVLDIRMPGMNGLELQKKLIEQRATILIIFLTGHGDIPMAVEAMRRGAVDFMPKPFREQELLDRIQSALEQGSKRHDDATTAKMIAARAATLTPREHEVMTFIVQGKANKVIAIDLGVSQRTVEVHRAHVMEKMHAKTLADLVRMTLRDND